eukprot:4870373-Lingulodinium_polyedra.AAC.1
MRGELVLLPLDVEDRHSDARAAVLGPAGSPTQNEHAMVLLSLFDGTGMVRVGVDDMLRQLGAPTILRASYFAEINSDLGNAVK